MSIGLLCLILAGCADKGEDPVVLPPDAAPVPGTVSLTWAIISNGGPLVCTDVGGIIVNITVTPAEGGSGLSDTFSCNSGAGTSIPINPGIYNVAASLVATGNQPLTEPYLFNGVEVVAGRDTPLGAVSFAVVPEGTVEMVLQSNGGTQNCTPVADGGAGITALRLDVLDRQGVCKPVTFAIGAGAGQPAGTYVSDCAGATYGCIERDQTVRAEGVPSGQVSLVISGSVGGVECYTRTSQFNVPGNNLSVTLPTQVLLRSDIPECAAQ